MNKLLILGFTFWSIGLSAQQSCLSYEEKMQYYFDADANLERAVEMYEEYISKDCADKLLAYNFIGFAYYNISDFQKAGDYFILGENFFSENENNQEQYAINQMYTGLISIAKRDFESAIYHLEKAEKWVKKIDDNFIRATIFQNIGLVKVETDNLDEAEMYFDRAVNTNALDSISIGYIYQNLAFLNLKKGNTEKTTLFLKKTSEIWNDLDYPKGIYLLSFIQAKLAIKEKEFNKALNHLEQGRSAYEVDNKLLSGENYLIEAQIQDSLNNKEGQLIALEKAILESDDLSDKQLKETISNLSRIQDINKTNLVLAGLISKLKAQNLNQEKISLERNRIMDSESEENQSIIKAQLVYLAILATLLLLLGFLFLRIKKQTVDIQNLNTSLQSSKIEVENQVEKLKQKNKELEQFAYVAYHDLKSPLRTISAFAGLLKKEYGSNEFLDIITKSADNMSDMISELLRYSILDQKLNIAPINLYDLIQNTTQRIVTQISESQAVIKLDDSCNRIIQCDKSLFINVFQNLISNSITYCKDNEAPQISISAFEKNNQLVIKISDNGIGMDKA